jgi:hypothetical protein
MRDRVSAWDVLGAWDVSDICGKLADEVEMAKLTRCTLLGFLCERERQWFVIGEYEECLAFQHVTKLFDRGVHGVELAVVGTVLSLCWS